MNAVCQDLLYYCDMSTGGIVDYVRYQTEALSNLGIPITLLCPRDWAYPSAIGFTVRPELPANPAKRETSRLRQRLAFARALLERQFHLARVIKQEGFRRVLCASYSEYLAPLWAGKLRRLAKGGVVFGAVVHDPVRDFVVGPHWWHRWSIANGYSFLREAFVHAPIRLDTVRPVPRLRTTVVPFGSYPFPPSRSSQVQARTELNLPAEAKVMLSFGNIRDGKNLDLVLHMMSRFPDLYLIVAGKEQSGGQKPAAFYVALARELGVEERCRWLVRFIAEDEIGGLFAASDLSLLTYGAQFRSASSALGASIAYRQPCLASGGEGNLSDVISRYDLGLWISPDNLESLCGGIKQWLEDAMPTARWEDYEQENSWVQNAQLVAERMYAD